MVGLDLTHRALATPAVCERIAASALDRPPSSANCWHSLAVCTNRLRVSAPRRYTILRGGLRDRSERDDGAQSAGGYRAHRHLDAGYDGRGLPRATAAGLPHPWRSSWIRINFGIWWWMRWNELARWSEIAETWINALLQARWSVFRHGNRDRQTITRYLQEHRTILKI